MKEIISISGDIGSGKSSVAQTLTVLTHYEVLSSGTIQRAIAERRGLTTLDLNKVSQIDRSIDDEIDSQLVHIGQTEHRLIVDSRLAWHFIPDSFKVYLSVDPMIGAERVFNARRSTEINPSQQQTLVNNRDRQQLESDRFAELYNIDFRDHQNYELIVDTSHTAAKQVAVKINDRYQLWRTQQPFSPH